MMTKESFLKLAQKLGGKIHKNIILNSKGENVECLVFSVGLDPEGYADLLADTFTNEGFDVFCEHPFADSIYTDPIDLYKERAEEWIDNKMSVICCFLGKGWETIKLYERSGILRVSEQKLISSNREDTFSCMVEALSSEDSGYFQYHFVPGNISKGEAEIEILITHNALYSIMEN